MLAKKYEVMGSQYATKDQQVQAEYCSTIAAGVLALKKAWIDDREMIDLAELLYARHAHDQEVKQRAEEDRLTADADSRNQKLKQFRSDLKKGTRAFRDSLSNEEQSRRL